MNFNVVFTDSKSQFEAGFDDLQVLHGPGSGDMLVKIYDPQHRARDVFRFVDEEIDKVREKTQGKLLGAPGLIVGFNEAGEAVAIEMPESGAGAQHAAQHSADGSDPITPEAIGAAEAIHSHTPESIGAAPALTWGTDDLQAGITPLAPGAVYFVIE